VGGGVDALGSEIKQTCNIMWSYQMKKSLIRFLVFVVITLCTGLFLVTNVSASEKQEFISDSFCYVMVKNLLKLSEDKSHDGQLRDYHQWRDEIYPILDKKKLNDKEMKAYFLILYIAKARIMVHTYEYISETIVQRLEDNTHVFLKTLHELPYLIPIVASPIRSHFAHFSMAKEKNKFLRKYNDIFVDYLGDVKGRDFAKSITQTN